MKKIDNGSATVDNEFTDGNSTTGTPATILPAEWLNIVQAELAKIVEMAGISLDQTGADDTQIAKALATHCASLDFYNDTGAADAYILSPLGSGDSLNTSPPAYVDGLRVRFAPDNVNTGAAVAQIAGLPDKDIKIGAGAGSDPTAGQIAAGIVIELSFDLANDCWKLSSAASAAAVSLLQNGYAILDSGLILQWGRKEDVATVGTFPLTFPTACLNIVASHDNAGYQDNGVSSEIISASQFQIRSGTGVNAGNFLFYQAIGH